MLQFSDSDSDSDKGIRYKTDSTRNKIKHESGTSRSLDQQHTRDRRHETHRRRSKDRYKRRRSRSNSRYNKDDRHKRKSERKSSTRDRSPDFKKDGMKGNLAVSDKHSYDKTTSRQRKSSLSKKRTDESCKNSSSDSRKSKINRTKIGNEVEESLQKSKVKAKDNCNMVSEMNKEKCMESGDNMFGPSLPPHLQREKSSIKKSDKLHDEAGTSEQSLPTCSLKDTTTSYIENDEHSDRLDKATFIKSASTSGSMENNRINEEPPPNSTDSDISTADSGLPQSANIYEPASPNYFEKKNILELNREKPYEKLKELSVEKVDNVISQIGSTSPPQLMGNDASDPSVSKADNCENSITIIGPALPPHLQKKEPLQSEKVSVTPSIEQDEGIANSLLIGPALPPHLEKNHEMKQDERDNREVVGPALPPHLQKKVGEQAKIIGPSLPPHLRQQLEAQLVNIGNEEQNESEEDDTYGPLPPGMSVGRAHVELEERALQLKIDQLGPKGDDEPKREEWMLELPEAKAASFGLGPRQFRAREGPDMSDRSSWTTTPKDAAKKTPETKVDLKQESKLRHLKEKDKQQEEIVKTTKRTKKSLLEIHQKKLMKDQKSEEPAERRPFSRDIDLQVRRLDEAQKKAVLKNAQLLDDKFSSGQARYL